VFTLPEMFKNESDGDKGDVHDIKLVVASKDSAVSLDASKQPLDFVALAASSFI